MLIVTVSTQRSGTKLLGSCFNCGTQVRAFGELFNPDNTSGVSFATFVRSRGYNELVKLGSETALDSYFASITQEFKNIHFDLMFNQLEIPCLGWNPYSSSFMYGYLMSRNAIVISLERRLEDSFVSGQYLAVSKFPHRVPGVTTSPPVHTGLTLDLDAYREYENFVSKHRKALRGVMSSYRYFARIQYSELAENRWLPNSVEMLFGRYISDHNLPLNPAMIQLHIPSTLPIGIDYREAFVNYDTLQAECKASLAA
jgi:hypothetical protein